MDTPSPLKFEGSQACLTVKLAYAAGITKRVRDAPKSFEALKTTAKAQMCRKGLADTQAQDLSVTYADDTGDIINVSDDEDLITAYEVAGTHMKGNIKFEIRPRSPVPKAKTASAPDEEMKFAEKPLPQPSSLVQDPESDDSSDSDSDTPEMMSKEKKREQKLLRKQQREQAKQERQQARQERQEEKDANAPNKKCFKRLIKKEMERQCQQIFNDLLNSDNLGGEEGGEQIDSNASKKPEEVVHTRVACDGCDAHPIVGVRYKCSVCKNFDFCSKCEQRREHPHPFLKIYLPSQAPKAMFTVIDENMQNANPDIDTNLINPLSQLFGQWRNSMSQPQGMDTFYHGRGGRGGCGRGRGRGRGCHFRGGFSPFGGHCQRADGNSEETPDDGVNRGQVWRSAFKNQRGSK